MGVDVRLNVNQQIEVRALKDDSSAVYKSLVQGVEDNTFTIHVPTKGRDRLVLDSGDRVKVSYYEEGASIVFESTVISRTLEGDIPLYRLALPAEAERVQRREHVRLDISLNIRYQKVEMDEDNNPVPVERPQKAVTRDLSGGGLQLVSRERLEVNDLILVYLDLKDWKGRDRHLQVLAVVKRVEMLNQRGQQCWAAGVAFKEINPRDQDVIVSFIFRKMLERRRMTDR